MPKQNDFIDLLQLLVERTTTLSVRFEALRVLLEERGVLPHDQFEQKVEEIRKQRDLHFHAALAELSEAEFFAKLRQTLGLPEDTRSS